jgi:cytochrome c oxidase assembly protein subunit 15
MNLTPPTPDSPRWLHLLAVLTVIFTLPLLFLGAGVTTHGVGLIDPLGFRPPWEIVNGLLENSGLAWRLEYGHRTFGFLVGLCGIGLAIGCWFFDSRPWMGWLALAALTLICVQGALGILRVDLHARYGRTFAMTHGILAQIVFAALLSLAVLTSRRWMAMPAGQSSVGLQRWSIVTALLVFVQLVLGGWVRHQESPLGPRAHLLGAFVVVGALVWLLKLIRESETAEAFKIQRWVLKLVLVLQLWLGIESWLARFHVPHADLPQLAPMPMHAEWLRTSHYLMGTLLFGSTLVIALIANRRAIAAAVAAAVAVHSVEGAR